MSILSRPSVPVWIVAGLLGWPTVAPALHRESLPAIRVTTGAAHFLPHTRSWGRYLAFTSEQDLLGNGSTGRQVFVFSQLAAVCDDGIVVPASEGPCPDPPVPALVQVTAGPGDPADPSVVVTGDGSTLVAFDAYGSHAGHTGDVAVHRQVYLRNVTTGVTREITSAADGDSTDASLDAAGDLLVFTSRAPSITAVQQVGNPAQVIAVATSLAAPAIWVLTAGAADSIAPLPDAAGDVVAFQSTADLRGDGHDTGIPQVFVALLDRDGAPPVTLRQLTDGDAMSRRPYPNDTGTQVVFESAATTLPGGPPGPGIQVFVAPTHAGDTPSVTRITDANTFGDCTWPGFDPDGTRVGMICTGDFWQNGTTGNRTFVVDLTQTSPVGQLDSTGDVQGPLIQSLGSYFLAIATRQDMTGGGACEHQLAVVDYYAGHWPTATHLHEAPPGVAAGDPDDGCTDGVICTADTCDVTAHLCHHTPLAGTCDDHNVCTTADVCGAGVCVGAGTLDCDDGDPCTADACDPATGCTHVASTAACDDGDPCTTNDRCSATGCHGTAVVCADTNLCDGTRSCDPQTGQCLDGPAPDCDDGNPCTDDACDPATGCTHTANTATCDDGDPCTVDDRCATGTCSGAPRCDDGDACTIDACSTDGRCHFAPVPDFLVCEIAALNDGLDALGQTIGTGKTQIDGAARRKRLAQRVQRARRQMSAAATATERRLVKQLTVVQRQLGLFTQTLDAAGTHVDASLSATLHALAADLVGRVARVDASVTSAARP